MTHDQFDQDVVGITDEPSYRAGYRAGLAGMSTPRHFDVLLEQVMWADGFEAGSAEARKNAGPNDDLAPAGGREARR